MGRENTSTTDDAAMTRVLIDEEGRMPDTHTRSREWPRRRRAPAPARPAPGYGTTTARCPIPTRSTPQPTRGGSGVASRPGRR
jgi:hypothetical protein